jgi:hypothetical protein
LVLAAAGLDIERRAEASGWAILGLTCDALMLPLIQLGDSPASPASLAWRPLTPTPLSTQTERSNS